MTFLSLMYLIYLNINILICLAEHSIGWTFIVESCIEHTVLDATVILNSVLVFIPQPIKLQACVRV